MKKRKESSVSKSKSAVVSVSDKDDQEKVDGLIKTRDLFGVDETTYVMDAKNTGNIGRYLNVS